MRELKNFVPQTKEKEKIEERKTQESVDKRAVESDVERLIEEREGRSEDELMSELLSSVNKAKAEGRFNKSELENFKKTVLPFLSNEQTKRLEEILAVLE